MGTARAGWWRHELRALNRSALAPAPPPRSAQGARRRAPRAPVSPAVTLGEAPWRHQARGCPPCRCWFYRRCCCSPCCCPLSCYCRPCCRPRCSSRRCCCPRCCRRGACCCCKGAQDSPPLAVRCLLRRPCHCAQAAPPRALHPLAQGGSCCCRASRAGRAGRSDAFVRRVQADPCPPCCQPTTASLKIGFCVPLVASSVNRPSPSPPPPAAPLSTHAVACHTPSEGGGSGKLQPWGVEGRRQRCAAAAAPQGAYALRPVRVLRTTAPDPPASPSLIVDPGGVQ